MFWPLAVYFVLVVVLAAGMLAVSALLGERHRQPSTGIAYEGGVASQDGARVRLSAQYYLVAMFFVIFDLEAAFIFTWAGVARLVDWRGYAEVTAFIGILLITLWYLVRVGGLDWSRRS